ncbi:MAG TPA: hypothetical protein VMI53_10460 [Opitutaceae bacterium]|nr:hypothetical protein [Opitutaceae bacterium]
MKSNSHFIYIAGSLLCAFLAVLGVVSESPLLYATVPGIVGGIMAASAFWRFAVKKQDVVGFIATTCGFVYYQAFQANPVMLPEFSASLESIPMVDKLLGLFLGNLTTAILLISYHIMWQWLGSAIRTWVPSPSWASRADLDRKVMTGFWIVFALVAIPNVLFGKVIMGAIDNILYQRLTWEEADNYSGFAVWGGALGGSVANLSLWATSLFLIWLYLLRSPYRKLMLGLSPLILLWTAGVALQGSRTYLVTIGMAVIVYLIGDPRLGKKTFVRAASGVIVLFLLVQISTLFRGSGLESINTRQLSKGLFVIRGNEGTSSQIDGLQFFRTELWEKHRAANPMIGLFRGLVERPIEGLVMPIPRSLFPWKFDDESGHEFNLWFINVRLGVATDQQFLGASPGLIGRELIKYGIFGPFTLLFWLGLLLALANRLYATDAASDFHRIFTALVIAFIVAQSRDFAPVWFIPFLPAAVVFGFVARQARSGQVAAIRRARESGRPVVAAPHH